jgi:type IV fimbrial biogenesis protein FimT
MEGLKSGSLWRAAPAVAWKARMTRHNNAKSRMRGVSLLEILIAMAILGIIVSVAMPSMSGFGANQRLIGAAEQVFGHLQQARAESVARNAAVFVNFAASGTTTWTYGVSTTGSCTLTITDPTTANACIITVNDGDTTYDGIGGATDTGDRVLMRFPSTDYDDVKMAIASFSSGGTQIIFNPIRGTATSGQINLEGSTGDQLRVTMSLLGRAAICSPGGSVDAYEAC